MQMVINISEESYKNIKEQVDKRDYPDMQIGRAIADGTELKVILNRLKVRMKDRDEDNGGEPLNAVDRGYHLAYEHLCEEIDNLLKENE